MMDVPQRRIEFGWPGDGATVTIKSLCERDEPAKITKVMLLGHERPLKWSRDAEGLNVVFPNAAPCRYAFALKIRFDR